MSQYRQQGSVAYLISIVLVAVIGGLLFGYDTAVISGAEKGLQAFFENAKDFAYTNAMHGFTTSSALIGCVIGALVSGRLAISFGRKRTLFIAGILFLLSALGSWYPEFLFFEKGVPTAGLLIAFNAYRVLGGLGVGLASAICPMYIAEIAPARKRGRLVSWNQFAIIFGQLVVYFVFALLILLVPETPRYLAIHGQEEKALRVLSNINGEARAREILSEIEATVRKDAVKKNEKLFTYGIMVIYIGCMLSVFQQIIGINAVLYFAPRIFASMGMDDPMFQTVLMGIINITFTLVAVFTGSLGMAVGALGVALSNVLTVPAIVPVASIMVYSACFMFSWGPICWVYISEIFPNTIRSQATAIAVAFQWIFNFIVSSTFVPLYDMSHFFVYALYGGVCLVAALFVWKLVPETKGKTLEEMNALWKNLK